MEREANSSLRNYNFLLGCGRKGSVFRTPQPQGRSWHVIVSERNSFTGKKSAQMLSLNTKSHSPGCWSTGHALGVQDWPRAPRQQLVLFPRAVTHRGDRTATTTCIVSRAVHGHEESTAKYRRDGWRHRILNLHRTALQPWIPSTPDQAVLWLREEANTCAFLTCQRGGR